jgi:heterodisulfide reductase subunit A-like polyferredoxin
MVKSRWNYETDILVVGSGAAAYSAAITARSKGAEVIMMEKAAIHGGTTLRSGGGSLITKGRCSIRKINPSPDYTAPEIVLLRPPPMHTGEEAAPSVPR